MTHRRLFAAWQDFIDLTGRTGRSERELLFCRVIFFAGARAFDLEMAAIADNSVTGGDANTQQDFDDLQEELEEFETFLRSQDWKKKGKDQEDYVYQA